MHTEPTPYVFKVYRLIPIPGSNPPEKELVYIDTVTYRPESGMTAEVCRDQLISFGYPADIKVCPIE